MLGLCAGLFALAVPRDAHATYLKIAEVITGTQANPNVKYVVLRFWANGGDTDGYTLYQYDNSNPSVGMGTTTLVGNVGNTQKGAPILLANPDAESFFKVNADYHLTGQPLAAQGGLCLVGKGKDLTDFDDCVTWGGAFFPSAQHGTRANVFPFNPTGGIQPGMVMQRLTDSSSPSTSWSSRDFWLAAIPWPENNTGMLGVAAAGTCGNGFVEGMEECDDGAASNGPGRSCNTTCRFNIGANCPAYLCPDTLQSKCPNGVTEPGEQCDDRNTANRDGCSATCRWESLFWGDPNGNMCGNHILESGEQCDPPGTNCDTNCQLKSSVTLPFCGDGAVESPENPNYIDPNDPNTQEQCDPADSTAPAAFACTATCRWPANHTVANCNNYVLEAGEQCDDGNLTDGDGCSHTCTFETQWAGQQADPDKLKLPAWSCGDGFLSPGEVCDHGTSNGVGNDSCKSDCTLVNPPVFQSNAGGGVTGATNTGGTTTAGTNTGGTVTGATTTAGTTTRGTNTGGTVIGATTTAGTTTAGMNTGGTTTAGTTTAMTTTAGTTTAMTTTAGTTTAATTTAGTTTAGTTTAMTTTAGTTTSATTTAGTNTGGTVTGATNTTATTTAGTNTGGTVTGATTTAGTTTAATNTGGTVTGATTTAGTVTGATNTGGTTAANTTGGSPTTGGTTSASTTTAGATTAVGTTTTTGSAGGGTTTATSIDGGTTTTTGGNGDVKGISCRNLDSEGAAWLAAILGLLLALRGRPAWAPVRGRA